MKFGIIGCGRMAREHAKAIRTLGHEVKYFVSGTDEKKKQEFWLENPNTFLAAKQAFCELARPLDGIVHAGSFGFLSYWPELNNVPMLIEKPVSVYALEIDVLKKMREATTLVGYNRRFYSFIPYLRRSIKEKELFMVDVTIPDDIERYKREGVKHLDEFSLMYWPIHVFDLLYFLLDINNDYYSVNWNDAGDYAFIKFSTIYIPIIRIKYAQENKYIPKVEFVFQDGSDILLSTLELMIENNKMIAAEEWNGKAGIFNQMRNFIDVIAGRKNKVGATLDDAYRNVRFCEKLLEHKRRK